MDPAQRAAAHSAAPHSAARSAAPHPRLAHRRRFARTKTRRQPWHGSLLSPSRRPAMEPALLCQAAALPLPSPDLERRPEKTRRRSGAR
ncbi:hypothetical protein ZWY2020_009194 [Hordeum vulgare]|nr:hypothetical protein ZWY2020_009194 [Hordeum vulgare]